MGDKKEVPKIYDESTDDISSLGSSPYQSDEEIIESLFSHGNESTSSSDDQETLHAAFPSMAIDKDESSLILDQTALKMATDPGHRIFPQSAKKHLEHPVNRLKVITEEISDQQVETNLILNQTDLKGATDPGHTIFPHSAKANLELSLQNTSDEVDELLQNPGDDVDVISREIQNVLYQHDGWAYIAHQMAHIGKFECRKLPNMSICDVAIIRATQPLHILTFVEDGGKQEHAVEYNAQLTRSIMGFIKEKTGVSLDVVYGVVPASKWKDEKMFKEKLERLETVARRKALPGYLHMDTERYTVITKALVDLYSEPGEKPQEDPPNPVSGEAEPGVSQTDTMQKGEDHAVTGCYSLSQCPQPPDSLSLPPQGRNPRQTGYPTFYNQHCDAGDTFDPGSPQGCKYFPWGPKRAERGRWTSQSHTIQEAERLRRKFLEHMYDKKGKLIRAKIFIFDPSDAGKSSFCNGLRSALKDSDTPSDYFADRNLYRSLTSRFQASRYGDHSIIHMPGIFESSDFSTENIEAIASESVRFDDLAGNLNTRHEGMCHVLCWFSIMASLWVKN
ncbi:uncharacterized protein [Haliotis cracherodii]|uniref:uncharacterized protein n=1 Tax=Haliotis cracherodii TaxID=6455 RepID=UPI0039ED3CE7